MSVVNLESVRGHVEVLQYIRDREAEMKEMKKNAEDAIKAAMGGHDTGVLDNEVVVTYVHYKSKMFQGKEFAEQHPDLAALFTAQIEKRRFGLK